MVNHLILIGWTGSKSCYLNVTREEALRRYMEANPEDEDPTIKELDFTDEFTAYDAWT